MNRAVLVDWPWLMASLVINSQATPLKRQDAINAFCLMYAESLILGAPKMGGVA